MTASVYNVFASKNAFESFRGYIASKPELISTYIKAAYRI